MSVQSKLFPGRFFDSVSLMTMAQAVRSHKGVEDVALVMGTEENKDILRTAKLMTPEAESARPTDLIATVQSSDKNSFSEVFGLIEQRLQAKQSTHNSDLSVRPRSLHGACQVLPEADLCLISVPGRYAAAEAFKALEANLHVMIFSDNVSLEDEIALKTLAHEKGRLVMGPDCGTAIINGVPLAFANAVHRGSIGIVAASGTGLQEVSSIISNLGGGISQAIGTGGRDLSEAVGGIMTLDALAAFGDDPNTQVIVLISKPPHASVAEKLAAASATIDKPVVAAFLGQPNQLEGLHHATTLAHAAQMAVALAKGNPLPQPPDLEFLDYWREITNLCADLPPTKRWVRGLFSGGTLCGEAWQILHHMVGRVCSNVSPEPQMRVRDEAVSSEHTLIDMGADSFTVGRPHPMIDFSSRMNRMVLEASDPEVAVILFDLVLGYGSHANPLAEIMPTLEKCRAKSDHKPPFFICGITGTDRDPQNRQAIMTALRKAQVLTFDNNADACLAAGLVAKFQGGDRA